MAKAVRRLRSRDHWQSVFRTPDGFQIKLDLGAYPDCTMAYGLYELDTARLIKKRLKPGDHFVDGGANIGYFTLLAAKLVGPTGRVDAFEPHPTNRARLLENLDRNALRQRVNVHPLALTDTAGQAEIYTGDSDDNHGSASLYAENAAAAQSQKIQTARMDQVLQDTQPDLVKLDVEGAEPLAIEGMAALLTTANPPALIVEYNPTQSRVAGFGPSAFLERLLAIQPAYRAYFIGRSLKRLEPTEAGLAPLRQGNLLLKTD